MENKEDLESKFLELVQEQSKKSGVANGIDLYNINLVMQIDIVILREIRDKLLSEKRIVPLNHLNGVSYILPKQK